MRTAFLGIFLLVWMGAKADTLTYYHLYLGDSLIGQGIIGYMDSFIKVDLDHCGQKLQLSAFQGGCMVTEVSKSLTLISADSQQVFSKRGYGWDDDRRSLELDLPPPDVLRSTTYWTVALRLGSRKYDSAIWRLRFE